MPLSDFALSPMFLCCCRVKLSRSANKTNLTSLAPTKARACLSHPHATITSSATLAKFFAYDSSFRKTQELDYTCATTAHSRRKCAQYTPTRAMLPFMPCPKCEVLGTMNSFAVSLLLKEAGKSRDFLAGLKVAASVAMEEAETTRDLQDTLGDVAATAATTITALLSKIEDLQGELRAEQEARASFETSNETLRSQNHDLEAKLRAEEQSNASLDSVNSTIQSQNHDLEIKLRAEKQSNASLESANSTIQSQNHDLGTKLRAEKQANISLESVNTTLQSQNTDLEIELRAEKQANSSIENASQTLQIEKAELETKFSREQEAKSYYEITATSLQQTLETEQQAVQDLKRKQKAHETSHATDRDTIEQLQQELRKEQAAKEIADGRVDRSKGEINLLKAQLGNTREQLESEQKRAKENELKANKAIKAVQMQRDDSQRKLTEANELKSKLIQDADRTDQAHKSEKQTLQDQLETAESQKQALQGDLEAVESREQDLKGQLKTLQKKYSILDGAFDMQVDECLLHVEEHDAMQLEYFAAHDKAQGLEDENAALRAKIATLKQELDAEESELDEGDYAELVASNGTQSNDSVNLDQSAPQERKKIRKRTRAGKGLKARKEAKNATHQFQAAVANLPPRVQDQAHGQDGRQQRTPAPVSQPVQQQALAHNGLQRQALVQPVPPIHQQGYARNGW
jgi:chromosome segregation ATPase